MIDPILMNIYNLVSSFSYEISKWDCENPKRKSSIIIHNFNIQDAIV